MAFMDESTITAALGALRSGLQADGFDLYLMNITAGGDVVVCLEAKPEACLDCLVPDHMLQQVVTAAVRRADPGAGQVTLVKKGFEALDPH
jgi:hypothetical protein